MFCNFIISKNSNQTEFIFNDYLCKYNIQPKIISVKEHTEVYQNPLINDNLINASMFLPPINSMDLLLDKNDYGLFRADYESYLNSELPTETILIIIRHAMDTFSNTGGNGLIIFDLEMEDIILDPLKDHLFYKYGISLYPEYPHNINFDTLSTLSNLMYGYSLLTKEEFIRIVPKFNDGRPNVYDFNKSKFNNDGELL